MKQIAPMAHNLLVTSVAEGKNPTKYQENPRIQAKALYGMEALHQIIKICHLYRLLVSTTPVYKNLTVEYSVHLSQRPVTVSYI